MKRERERKKKLVLWLQQKETFLYKKSDFLLRNFRIFLENWHLVL